MAELVVMLALRCVQHGLWRVPAHRAGVAEAEVGIVAAVDIADARALRCLGIDRKAARPAPHR